MTGDALTGGLLDEARALVDAGDLRTAASVYDRGYGLDPHDATLAGERLELLDRLAVEEHGIRFRYIPAGTLLMGSERGDPDERPVHRVELGDFWLAETTMSWAAFCDLSGWQPPPVGLPDEPFERPARGEVGPGFFLYEQNKIRLQYCEDQTLRARDWHAHVPEPDPAGAERRSSFFGVPWRDGTDRPWSYDTKPMVSIAWQDAETLGTRLSTSDTTYGLPTEAEWERAARGGLVERRYPWGDEPPTHRQCDFDRLGDLSILPVRLLPPNGYGLHGMAGSVWEWTSDWYDAEYYATSPTDNPTGPGTGEERVLRGGSWTDCADVVTVSFRMSRGSRSWTEGGWSPAFAANVGVRLCRRQPPRPVQSSSNDPVTSSPAGT
jgi:formylglycine-generating enzyme required for sulfatase activity